MTKFISENSPEIKEFNRRGIYRMKQFYDTYRDNRFVSPVVTQSTWTNHLLIFSNTKRTCSHSGAFSIIFGCLKSITFFIPIFFMTFWDWRLTFAVKVDTLSKPNVANSYFKHAFAPSVAYPFPHASYLSRHPISTQGVNVALNVAVWNL